MTKSNIKQVGTNLSQVAVKLATLLAFTVIEGVTSSGKKCYSALTTKRLSIDDFKSLMHDITLAGGYGFTKFYPEHKAKLISCTGLEATMFNDLCNQYTWNEPQPKESKETKKSAKKAAKVDLKAEGIDLTLLNQFKAFLASQK